MNLQSGAGGSAVKSIHCSCKRPGFSSHYPHGSSQPSVLTNMVHTYKFRRTTHIHKINNLKKKFHFLFGFFFPDRVVLLIAQDGPELETIFLPCLSTRIWIVCLYRNVHICKHACGAQRIRYSFSGKVSILVSDTGSLHGLEPTKKARLWLACKLQRSVSACITHVNTPSFLQWF